MTQVLDFCLWISAPLQVPQNFRHLRKGVAPHTQQRLKCKVLRGKEVKKG